MSHVNKTVSHHSDHETWIHPYRGDLNSHTPGVEIQVTWTAGYAEQAGDAFDRAVAKIRAQIVDAEEPAK